MISVCIAVSVSRLQPPTRPCPALPAMTSRSTPAVSAKEVNPVNAGLPIPPPPPGGWSGVCKTVINTAGSDGKMSALATADKLSKQVVVPAADDTDMLMKKKAETKERQKAKRGLLLNTQPASSDKG